MLHFSHVVIAGLWSLSLCILQDQPETAVDLASLVLDLVHPHVVAADGVVTLLTAVHVRRDQGRQTPDISKRDRSRRYWEPLTCANPGRLFDHQQVIQRP
ncbi:hypothetical protein V8F06_012911 [Rhypophila decipiens]